MKNNNQRSKMEDLLETQVEPTRSIMMMEKVGKRLGWNKEAITELINPQEIIILRLPVRFLGKVVVFWGCISLHNNARGPYKGGIRISPDVSIWETVELSRLMTLKTALTEVEFGGGKTGIRVDFPEIHRRFNKKERDVNFEKVLALDVCEEFAQRAKQYLVNRTYIPAPDMGTGPEEMAFIYNQTLDPASVTGKPEGIHGWLPGRKESTGYGCSYITLRFIQDIMNLKLEQTRVAIQGFGNVGSYLAKYLSENKVKVVAVSDIYGGIYDERGLDIEQLMKYNVEHGTIKGFVPKDISNQELLALDVDVLIPAASSNVLNHANSHEVKAKLIVEAANAPITYEAMEILDQKKVMIIPDILANSGGVIASMEEYSRSLSAIKIKKVDVFKIIAEKLAGALEGIYEKNKTEKISYPEAAIEISMKKIYDAMVNRRQISVLG
ncbi:MAG: Glu/Leu/Phe/Val dehydrogenase [bacterium]